MNPQDLNELVRNAKEFYENKLRLTLEATHPNDFVAIEPVSGDYFIGKTLSEAMGGAHDAHPDRLAHAIRVGHDAALHFGVSVR